jgi:hypothetical protein
VSWQRAYIETASDAELKAFVSRQQALNKTAQVGGGTIITTALMLEGFSVEVLSNDSKDATVLSRYDSTLPIGIAWREQPSSAFLTIVPPNTASLTVSTSHGRVGVHFSQYLGANVFGQTDWIPLIARDHGQFVSPERPLNASASIPRPGEFVLDIADWQDNPQFQLELRIGGELVIKASGSKDNYRDWQKDFGHFAIKQTNARELHITVP